MRNTEGIDPDRILVAGRLASTSTDATIKVRDVQAGQ